MCRFLLLWGLTFFSFLQLNAQNQLRFLYSFPGKDVRLVAADHLMNIYSISDFEIKKYNNKDTLATRYSEMNYGQIHSVDFSNPLRIPVFYADFNKLIFLDNTLNVLKDPIDFVASEYNQITTICSAYDGGIWVYSRDDFSLTRYSVNFMEKQKMQNLNTFIDSNLEIKLMLEKDNRLFLLGSDKKIYLFDIYGAFIKSIPLDIENRFTVYGNTIYWLKQNFLHAFDLLSFTEQTLLLPFDEIDAFDVNRNRLVILANEKVAVFSIEN